MEEAGEGGRRRKVIINTDPGIDDAIALLMALSSSEIEVLGIVTTFGNTTTALATKNARILCEAMGRRDVQIYEGEHGPLNGAAVDVADFSNGADGLGNVGLPEPNVPTGSSFSFLEFFSSAVAKHPKEVSILSLGPLTNVAKAIQKDSSFLDNLGSIWVMGGSFMASGNVNAAAEAHIFSDPEAADLVLTSGADIFAIGLNVTTRAVFPESYLEAICDAKSAHSSLIFNMTRTYRKWHVESDHLDGIFLHDACCLIGFLHPNLFEFRKGTVRVETEGICRGMTLLDLNLKNWNGPNPWVGVPQINVATGVDQGAVTDLIKKNLLLL